MSYRVPKDEFRARPWRIHEVTPDFDVEDVTTVGGLVYTLFGRVPKSGEAIARDGFRIVVERVRRRRIERVYFERLVAAQTPAEDE